MIPRHGDRSTVNDDRGESGAIAGGSGGGRSGGGAAMALAMFSLKIGLFFNK